MTERFMVALDRNGPSPQPSPPSTREREYEWLPLPLAGEGWGEGVVVQHRFGAVVAAGEIDK